MLRGFNTDRRKAGEGEEDSGWWSAPVPVWRLQGLGRTSELLPGRLLLIRAKLEVLGGQFETQRVGSQRVNHVLVAFPTVFHEERTPVGLGRADQLQTLQRSDMNTVVSHPKMAANAKQLPHANYSAWESIKAKTTAEH